VLMHALAASCEELRARTGNPPLGYQFSMGHMTSSDQGHCYTRGKSLGTRLASYNAISRAFKLYPAKSDLNGG
jgi:hypothetical protein